MTTGVIWEGDPIIYRRKPRGHGLVIRDLHYLFDASGRIERISGLNKDILIVILKQVYRNDPRIDPVLMTLAKAPGTRRMKVRLETKKWIRKLQDEVSNERR